MESPIFPLRSPAIQITQKLHNFYSENIFHADFKSKYFSGEYLRTTSEKFNMKKWSP